MIYMKFTIVYNPLQHVSRRLIDWLRSFLSKPNWKVRCKAFKNIPVIRYFECLLENVDPLKSTFATVLTTGFDVILEGQTQRRHIRPDRIDGQTGSDVTSYFYSYSVTRRYGLRWHWHVERRMILLRHVLGWWASTTMRIHKFVLTPSNGGQGVGLSRRAWTLLNWLRTGSVDLVQTCCAGDCPQATVVIVVSNKRQTTSLVEAVKFTARLRG